MWEAVNFEVHFIFFFTGTRNEMPRSGLHEDPTVRDVHVPVRRLGQVYDVVEGAPTVEGCGLDERADGLFLGGGGTFCNLSIALKKMYLKQPG